MISLFNKIYKNTTVLVTGHTGFKGSWLVYWLYKMGANVVGYSLKFPTKPNHLELLKDIEIISIIGDIRDLKKLDNVIAKYNPDIVFHLAAQPLVRYSYQDPILTYETNVIGTLKVFEACKKNNVKAIINITSDKCYENKEWIWGYKETDRLGGYDPYSSSKACSEILTSSYRNSYFNIKDYKKTHITLLASCRAGNVIGGGDWAEDRLIPDIIKATYNNKKIYIRSPKSIRPWQHVLEPLSGYLLLGQKLLEEKKEFAYAWNFAPEKNEIFNVEEIVKKTTKYWDKIDYKIDNKKDLHEANLLNLDCSKANFYLKWNAAWGIEKTIQKTICWYKDFYINNKVNTYKDLQEYINDANSKGISWAN